ncbi:MAG: hypothetical protein KJ060_01900 [Candidatus Hydrogenedentes bacterium]|nr:hypothetical protein [Candidatus Hydrogenedentota bacterium]
MRDPNKKPHPLVALRMRYHDTYDAVSLFVYLFIIYIWSVTTYPMGRDFEVLATAGNDLPFLAGQLFRLEMAVFGTWLPGYHFVNMLLLYACVMCVYYFTNLTVRGLWWFGTLSACLFLANPVHSEAVLNISGVGDLIPCLIALLALTAYAAQVRNPKAWKVSVAFVLFIVATVPYASNATLILVIVLFELLVARTGERSFARLGVFFVAGIAGLFAHAGDLITSGVQLAQRMTPLYFLFYPLGFLPKTVVAFHERPWLGWLAVLVVIGLFALIYRKARRPVILFGVLAMVALRLGPLDRPVDFVSLIGGGQLLLANAFFTIGLVALFFCIMEHPKWRISMVGITTSLVIILFAMQFISVRRWHDAGERVAAFQAEAKEVARDGAIGVLPDYRDYYGAPMNLSDAIAYDTIFSEAIPAVSILPLRAERTKHRQDVVTEWSSAGGVLTLTGDLPNSVYGLFPNPSALAEAREGTPVSAIAGPQAIATANATISIADAEHESVTIVITAEAPPLPERVIPGLPAE